MDADEKGKSYGAMALTPIAVFLLLYIGCGAAFTCLGVVKPFNVMLRYVAVMAGIIVVMMISGMIGLIRYYGGLECLVAKAKGKIRGRKSYGCTAGKCGDAERTRNISGRRRHGVLMRVAPGQIMEGKLSMLILLLW